MKDTKRYPQRLTFYRRSNGKWYVRWMNFIIPEPARMMVSGTEIILDKVAGGRDRVTVKIFSDNPKITLTKVRETFWGGADYAVTNHIGLPDIPDKVWICNVTRFVFKGSFPDTVAIDW